jgi:hypothetical protein
MVAAAWYEGNTTEYMQSSLAPLPWGLQRTMCQRSPQTSVSYLSGLNICHSDEG